MNSITDVPPPEAPDVWLLLEDERKHATGMWTVLNEMRRRGELPQWVLENLPHTGTRRHLQERRAAVGRVNAAILDAAQPVRQIGEVIDVQAVEVNHPALRGRKAIADNLTN